MRISLENTGDHVQVKIVKDFARRLAERTGDRLEVRVFEEARLFRDRDVVMGLLQNKAEMAVPGIWNIEPMVPELGVLLLPSMYGLSSDRVHRLVDGEFGGELTGRVEKSLGVSVPGRWIDLGHAHLFTLEKRIRRYSDLQGLLIRVAGGTGNELRIRTLGAEAVSIAWPDFPARLAAGAVDGVLTTYETIASARLWEAGIRYVFEDSQYFSMYIPIVNTHYFAALPEDVRQAILEEWEASVDDARRAAARAQQEAKKTAESRGVRVSIPAVAEKEAARRRMLEQEDVIRRQMGITTSFYSRFRQILEETGD